MTPKQDPVDEILAEELSGFEEGGEVQAVLNTVRSQLKPKLTRLLVEARVDELTDMLYGHSRDVTLSITDKDGEVYTKEQFDFISRYEVQERLAELRSKL